MRTAAAARGGEGEIEALALSEQVEENEFREVYYAPGGGFDQEWCSQGRRGWLAKVRGFTQWEHGDDRRAWMLGRNMYFAWCSGDALDWMDKMEGADLWEAGTRCTCGADSRWRR